MVGGTAKDMVGGTAKDMVGRTAKDMVGEAVDDVVATFIYKHTTSFKVTVAFINTQQVLKYQLYLFLFQRI
uniref:Uncharacterized protein n=1 Tax=Pithovirus LCPAC404 TaxID=2506597 RepID=A0A481ZBQ5_9VIRU|nr:MAG: hypothetical protein LCPAC404_00220 [Pithovirus LCPAC404]